MSLSTSPKPSLTGVRRLIAEIAPGIRFARRRRTWVAPVLALVGAGIFALVIATHGGQFVHAINRALHTSWRLVVVATALEAASIAGYVVLLHRVAAAGAGPQARLKDSYDMTLGGAAATRLLPTAGLGGTAVIVWGLRARGMRANELAERLLAFLLLLYAVYVSVLFASGAAVASGWARVTGGHGLGLLGAVIATGIATLIIIVFAAPSHAARMLDRIARRSPRLAPASRWAAAQLPVLGASLRRCWQELRRPSPALLGAVAYWAFDIGVLVTMLHAFGVRLPLAAVVLAYFMGTLFNLVPLPGSLSGGLAGCLIALGSPAGAAIAAVLAYRAIAVWVPVVPGLVSLAAMRTSAREQRVDTANRTLVGQLAV